MTADDSNNHSVLTSIDEAREVIKPRLLANWMVLRADTPRFAHFLQTVYCDNLKKMKENVVGVCAPTPWGLGTVILCKKTPLVFKYLKEILPGLSKEDYKNMMGCDLIGGSTKFMVLKDADEKKAAAAELTENILCAIKDAYDGAGHIPGYA